MKDFIPTGEGKSRFLKSVSNFLTLYPDYETFAAALISGTLPIDLNGVNSSGYSQLGTPLNKASLLADATATAFGLTPANATVNDALALLGNNAVYGEMVSYTGDGTYGSSHPCSVTFSIAPEIVIMVNEPSFHSQYGGDEYNCFSIVTAALTTSYVAKKGFFDWLEDLSYSYAKKSSNGKTISWYCTTNQYNQLNLSGTTYFVLGLWGTGI